MTKDKGKGSSTSIWAIKEVQRRRRMKYQPENIMEAVKYRNLLSRVHSLVMNMEPSNYRSISLRGLNNIVYNINKHIIQFETDCKEFCYDLHMDLDVNPYGWNDLSTSIIPLIDETTTMISDKSLSIPTDMVDSIITSTVRCELNTNQILDDSNQLLNELKEKHIEGSSPLPIFTDYSCNEDLFDLLPPLESSSNWYDNISIDPYEIMDFPYDIISQPINNNVTQPEDIIEQEFLADFWKGTDYDNDIPGPSTSTYND